MKKFINKLLFVILILSGQWKMVNGQVTTAIPYQGVARNAAGNIVANQPISLRFSILEGSATTGILVYRETHSVTTNSLGLFDVKITAGTPTGPGVFNPLAWQTLAVSGAFLKVEMDITGGSAYVDMGTTQLLSVPFALYAEKSGSSLGSVVYAGTWDAGANDPVLSSSTGIKGYYYVVTSAGTHSLNGITDWNVGDWVIYNGAIWQKVDNSQAPVNSSDVGFTPNGDITATNVQDAIVEVRNDTDTKLGSKLNLSGGTMTGDLVLNANPSTALGAATKQYVDAADALKADKVTGAVLDDIAMLDATGNLVDGGKKLSDYIHKDNTTAYTPSADYNPATKKYVDDADASNQTQINTKVSKSGDTMTGDLVLNANPSSALGAATKQYVDAADALKADKVTGAVLDDITVLDATGNLVDGGKKLSDYLDKDNTSAYTPSSNYNPATKKYVDDADALKADKVTGATDGHFATLTATGNLVDGGGKTAGNIAFVPTTLIPSTNVQDAIESVNSQFGTLIDSYIHRTEDGVSIYLPPGGTRKRFGIGDTAPESPLGISSEGAEQRVLTIKPGTLSTGPTYTFSLRSSGIPGFSIDDVSSGAGTSRLFIKETDGFVGIGTNLPNEKLHIESSTSGGLTGIKILNTATIANQGWSLGHINDASVVDRDGAFGIFENSVGGKVERITILPSGKTGINELIPDTKLHVSRPVAEVGSAIDLIEGTGIITIGPITNNIVADYRGIQARTGTYIGSTLDLVASELNIQRLGGDILIHGESSIAMPSKGIITTDAKLGLGTITPVERIDIDGAIKIGTTTNNNNGTIRWTGTDFEGRKAGAWVSLTSSSVANPWTTSPAGAIYYEPAGLHVKVGIGISTPTNALQVYDNENIVSSNSSAASIHSEATTSSSSFADTRVGLDIKTSSQWSTNADARNVGIFVSNVSGQASKEANIAAALNGNVVIGDLTSSKVIGSNGTNVLAIQTGSIPTTTPGTTATAGIQIYSDDLTSGVGSAASVFHLMNGDGTVIKLFRTDALTAPDNSALSTTIYGATEEAVINNLRSRINDLEARLQALGLLL